LKGVNMKPKTGGLNLDYTLNAYKRN